jgi:hypothetical protein
MAMAGVYGGRRAYFRIFCEGGVMKFYMKSFDFSGSLSSLFAVQFVQAATSGENSLDTFNRFHAARDGPLIIVLVRSLLQLLRGFKSIVTFL